MSVMFISQYWCNNIFDNENRLEKYDMDINPGKKQNVQFLSNIV